MQRRRDFLRLFAAGSAGAFLPATRGLANVALAPGASADEEYWELVKSQFPIREGLIMINAANLCPAPYVVTDQVTRLTGAINSDASFQNRARFEPLLEVAREGIATHIGAAPDEIAITRNTSEGNNTVVSGLDLGPGDEVVIWDENHPTNNLSWKVRAARDGFTVKVVTIPATGDLVQPLIAAFTGRTRVLAFSHLSNATGVLLPAARLCAEARSRGILTLVDGAQTFGCHHIDVQAMGCDFYTGSSHKWFAGPKEAGIFYVRKERLNDVWSSDVGVGWDDSEENGAKKFESLGQRDDACVSAMGTAARFQASIGSVRIEARVRELTEALITGLAERVPGVSFSMPASARDRGGIVIFSVPGIENRVMFERLYEEHQIACSPRAAGVRLSPHIYNTMADIERTVEAISTLA